jgi:hypothetical protein
VLVEVQRVLAQYAGHHRGANPAAEKGVRSVDDQLGDKAEEERGGELDEAIEHERGETVLGWTVQRVDGRSDPGACDGEQGEIGTHREIGAECPEGKDEGQGEANELFQRLPPAHAYGLVLSMSTGYECSA